MLRIMAITGAALTLSLSPAFAQAPQQTEPTKQECERNSTSAECTRVQSGGTVSGKDKSTISSGAGKGAEEAGSGKGGGVTPSGNPATAGGGPVSGQ